MDQCFSTFYFPPSSDLDLPPDPSPAPGAEVGSRECPGVPSSPQPHRERVCQLTSACRGGAPRAPCVSWVGFTRLLRGCAGPPGRVPPPTSTAGGGGGGGAAASGAACGGRGPAPSRQGLGAAARCKESRPKSTAVLCVSENDTPVSITENFCAPLLQKYARETTAQRTESLSDRWERRFWEGSFKLTRTNLTSGVLWGAVWEQRGSGPVFLGVGRTTGQRRGPGPGKGTETPGRKHARVTLREGGTSPQGGQCGLLNRLTEKTTVRQRVQSPLLSVFIPQHVPNGLQVYTLRKGKPENTKA